MADLCVCVCVCMALRVLDPGASRVMPIGLFRPEEAKWLSTSIKRDLANSTKDLAEAVDEFSDVHK